MKKILFDFNGTLFLDTDINIYAWKKIIYEITGDDSKTELLFTKNKGTRNEVFVRNIFEYINKDVSDEVIKYYAERKETEYYQKYCRENNRNTLTPGAEDLLNYLKKKDIAFNLCTASLKVNVDFYFEYLKLYKWFNIENVAYDDGTFKDKEDMYKACADRINADIKDCIVIEDSMLSIRQALKAGVENFIAIDSKEIEDIKEIKQRIKDFNEFNYSILER